MELFSVCTLLLHTLGQRAENGRAGDAPFGEHLVFLGLGDGKSLLFVDLFISLPTPKLLWRLAEQIDPLNI